MWHYTTLVLFLQLGWLVWHYNTLVFGSSLIPNVTRCPDQVFMESRNLNKLCPGCGDFQTTKQPAKCPKPQMATVLLDHTAAAVMAPVCSSGVAPQAHGFTLGRPHSPVSSSCFQLLLWRLLTLQNPDRCFVQCFRGEPHFSRLSKICPRCNTLHTSGASKNFSSLFLLFFVVEENGKLFNFFLGLAVSWSHLQSIELGRQTHGLAGS